MKVADLRRSIDLEAIGGDLYGLVSELYPICRSITGHGLRETLARVGRRIDLARHEVPPTPAPPILRMAGTTEHTRPNNDPVFRGSLRR